MADLSRFRALSAKEKALVAVAVLLDGHDAAEFLTVSERQGTSTLSKAASDLASLSLDLRLPLVGTMLRVALEDLKKQK